MRRGRSRSTVASAEAPPRRCQTHSPAGRLNPNTAMLQATMVPITGPRAPKRGCDQCVNRDGGSPEHHRSSCTHWDGRSLERARARPSCEEDAGNTGTIPLTTGRPREAIHTEAPMARGAAMPRASRVPSVTGEPPFGAGGERRTPRTPRRMASKVVEIPVHANRWSGM